MPKAFRTTVTGSYPRPVQPADTLKKPTLDRQQADEIIRWAVEDQVNLGLDIVADGEGRRENMYYFVQKRVDGLSFDRMEYRSYGTAGFGIEIDAVVGKIENPQAKVRRLVLISPLRDPVAALVSLNVKQMLKPRAGVSSEAALGRAIL